MSDIDFDSFLLEKLMDHLPASIFFKDKESRFIRINKSCAIKFGLNSAEEAIGKTDFDFFGEEHARKAREDEIKVMQTGEPLVGIIEKEAGSDNYKEERWASTTKLPLRNDSGIIIGTFGISRDITEQKRTELSLIESEKKYRNIFENIQDVIYRTDRRGIVTDISPSIEKYSGFDVNEIIGKSARQFYYNDDDWKKLNSELVKTGVIKNFEIRLETLDHKMVYTSVNAYQLRDHKGKVVGVEGIMRDVTDRKRAEEKLRESHETLEKLTKQAPGVIYQFRQFPDGRSCFPYASEGIKEIYGVTPEEVREDSGPVEEKIHKDDFEKVVKSINKSFHTLERWEIEFRVILPSRGIRWLHGDARPEKLEDNSVIWHGYISDITRQKWIQSANERLTQQFQAVFDTVPNMIFVKDREGRHIMANKATADYHQMTQEEIIGKTDVDLGTRIEEAKVYDEAAQKVIETGEMNYIPEVETSNPKGEKVWFQIIKVPFHQPDEREKTVLTVVTDITKLKQKEKELKESLDIISDQNQKLSNFAHIASHNLRNYAGNISMLISHYDLETDPEEQEELLELLRTSSERLNETIRDLNEMIDSQKISEGDIKLLNLKEYIEKVKEILTNEIISKNVSMKISTPDNLNVTMSSAYLESILLNLISNAIKYRHPDRRPVVDIKAVKKDGGIELTITDNGLGIDLERYGNQLFGMYNTFHGNKDSKGIGLFITKNQVESIGGSISVESKVDRGTMFTLFLPSGKRYFN